MAETIVFVAIVSGGLLLWFATGREKPVRYRRKAILTGSDWEFFYRLKHALPECLVCPQVGVAALIEPTGMGRIRQAALESINRQRVGYAIFDADMQLVAVVELSHRSRPSRREATRDAAFAAAGIRVVRFHAQRLPSEIKIRSGIFPRSVGAFGQHLGNSTVERGTELQYIRPRTPWRNTIGAHS